MLGKLVKQEMKITSRTILPMYLCFVVATLLLKLSFAFSEGNFLFIVHESSILNLLQVLLIFAYVILLVGVVLLTYFLVLKRFYSGMFGDEGYLMFTLPVTTRQLLNSKLISSFLWMLICAPLILSSFFLLFWNTSTYQELMYGLSFVSDELSILQTSGFSMGLILIELIVLGVIDIFSSLLSFYLAMTLGHHFCSEHRLLGSIGFYLAISMAESSVSSFLQSFFIDITNMSAIAEIYNGLSHTFFISIVLSIVLVLVYYIVIHHFLDKKLNLS